MSQKTKTILIVLLIFILISFGLFVYYENYYIKKGYYDFTRANVKEEIMGDIKRITDDRIGLSFEMPNDWLLIRDEETLLLESPDINFRNAIDFPQWNRGCRIVITFQRNERGQGWFTPYDVTKDKINELWKKENNELTSGNTTESIVDILNLDALKEVSVLRDDNNEDVLPMSITLIKLPIGKDVLYYFETMELLNNPVCEPIFEDFLSSLQIKQ